VIIAVLVLQARRRTKPFNFDQMVKELDGVLREGDSQSTNEAFCAPREVKRDAVELIDVLGEGQFGDVNKGLLTETKDQPGYLVAVKSTKREADKEEILKEATLMAQFHHDHVVRLVGVCTVGAPIYIILEYCEYG
jgi:serine/threonine protein kinase